ncbi:MAG TPA: hypothetical protein EYN25_04090 [Candidatus Nitrosopelagicus sp.]|nr:hypothetical protein [Candidatus Nitrosopelagicus sp.]
MKNFIIFPFLLAFFPSWILILKNYDELIFQDILISLAIIAVSVIVWIVITKIIKNGNKAALITGVGVGFFFYFGYVQDALDGIMIFNIPINKTSVLVIVSIIIFVLSTTYFVKSRKNFESAIKIANVITITLVLVVAIQFVIPDAYAEKPNVYHIILDEYTDNEILLKKFNYDNKKFLEFLNKNGFYIPNKSFSTFGSTPGELELILNMDYPREIGWVSDSYQALNNNKVMSVFSDQNYSIIETNSMMRWKNFSDVDTKLCYDTNFINSEFLDQVLRKSIIRYFLEQHHNDTRRDTVRCTFNELSEIASQSSGPKYIFSHIYVPHPPFLFGPNGENVIPDHREISGLQSWENPQGYINQLIYATNQVSIVVKNIVKNDPTAVIILQGDTGTLTGTDTFMTTMKDVYQAHSILYAVRIPDVNNLEYMVPVNTYRIIFNNYFNMDYEYLEQHSYARQNDVWTDITEKLREYRFD